MNGWPTTSVCTPPGPRRTAVGDAGLLRTGHEVVDEDAEATPRAGLEFLDDAHEIVDAAQVFDHHALDTEVVAPDLLDEFGVVPAFDVDPARQCAPWPSPVPPPSRMRCAPVRQALHVAGR